MRKLRDDS